MFIPRTLYLKRTVYWDFAWQLGELWQPWQPVTDPYNNPLYNPLYDPPIVPPLRSVDKTSYALCWNTRIPQVEGIKGHAGLVVSTVSQSDAETPMPLTNTRMCYMIWGTFLTSIELWGLSCGLQAPPLLTTVTVAGPSPPPSGGRPSRAPQCQMKFQDFKA